MRSFQSQSFRPGQSLKKVNLLKTKKTRWWSQIIFYVHPDFLGKWSNLTCAFFSDGWRKTTNPDRQVFGPNFHRFPYRPLMNFSGREAWRFDVDFEKMSEVALIQFNLLRFDGSVDWWIGWLIDGWIDWWLIDWWMIYSIQLGSHSVSQPLIL